MGILLCWNVKNILDLYLDKRLTAGAASRVAAHLKDCESCAAEAEDLGGVSRFLGQDADIAIPAGLEQAILKNLELEEDEQPVQISPPRLTPAKVFAVLYLMLIAGSHALPGDTTRGVGPQAAAEREALQ
jgi:anti-sigma factor RsiW